MSLQSELRRDEGYKIWPYLDSRGIKTWGIGHNLVASPLCPQAADLLGQAVQAQFDYDVAQVNTALMAYPWAATLDTVRLEAVQNLMFNMGASTFAKFQHFIGYMASGQYTLAATELTNSLAAKQDVERYTRLALQISTGVEK